MKVYFTVVFGWVCISNIKFADYKKATKENKVIALAEIYFET